MRFTIKLSVFVVLLVIITMLLILLSGALSIYSVSRDVVSRDWDVIAYTIDLALSSNTIHKLEEWLPILMRASNIEQIDIRDVSHVVAHFQVPLESSMWERFIATKRVVLELPQYPNYSLTLIYLDPAVKAIFSFRALSSIGIAIVFTVLLLLLSLYWLKPKFRGISLLEERARHILTGDRYEVSHSSDDEWPKDASQALDLLLRERQKRHKERTHVDTLIRAFFAQDAQTGVRSRLSFEHQLTTQLEEPNAHGIVMMVRLPDFDLQRKPLGNDNIDELQETLINILSTFVMRYPSALLARYFNNDFTILLPHSSLKEADNMASQLIHSVNTLSLDADIDRDTLMYIGITAYCWGQSSDMIMDYTNQATRNAELQGSNGWFIYDNNIPKVVLGSVRWRTLLNQVLENGQGLRFYEKPAITIGGKLHHREIVSRIYDGKQELLFAEFIPWLHQLRLTEQYDRKVIASLLPLLKRWPNESIAFSITVESLMEPQFFEWLTGVLREKGSSLCQRMMFELAEADVARYLEQLTPIVRTLSELGCRIAVVQAGLTVVSTFYIQQLPIEVIKLYSGLVRHIKMRPENQLIVESLCGACADSNVQIFATGVRTHSEWEVLREKGICGGQGDLFAPLERLPL